MFDPSAFIRSLTAPRTKPKAKPQERQSKAKPKRPGSEPVQRRVPIVDPWADTAIAQITFVTTCTGCSTEHRAPAEHLFLYRVSKHHGTRLEPLAPIMPHHLKLPRSFHTLERTAPYCHLCFDTAEISTPDLFPETRPDWSEQRKATVHTLHSPRYLDS